MGLFAGDAEGAGTPRAANPSPKATSARLPRGQALSRAGFAFCPSCCSWGPGLRSSGMGTTPAMPRAGPQPHGDVVSSSATQSRGFVLAPCNPGHVFFFRLGQGVPCQLKAEGAGVREEEDMPGEGTGLVSLVRALPCRWAALPCRGNLGVGISPGTRFLGVLESWERLSRATSRT